MSIDIVIPMAGLGSRFANAGFDKPKPFIDVLGRPMIAHVLDNLALPGARFILIARREHFQTFPQEFDRVAAGRPVTWIFLDATTPGAACTVLAAHRLLGDTPLLIANSDQLVDIPMRDFVADAQSRQLDGSILTFPSDSPAFSFARCDADGLVRECREKVPISQQATVGIYYWAKGRNFVDSAMDMIVANDKVNNEFYTCPVYNYAIATGARIGIYEIPATAMHCTGTPADLEKYVAFLKSRQ